MTSVEKEKLNPHEFALQQNYPNPFSKTTLVNYNLPVTSYVQLKIYNFCGKLIRTLVDAIESPGVKSVRWDGLDSEGQLQPEGVYFYQIEANSIDNPNNKFVQIKSMVKIKN